MQRHSGDNGVPERCVHYVNRADVPWDIQKYFQQRYSIFSKYDDGIWMTDDAWFGVTPEPVARKIAEHVGDAASEWKHILIDCFAGVGGNVIAFAATGRWSQIYAIEKDPAVRACGMHNAQIYGVADKITWVDGDCLEILDTDWIKLPFDKAVLFASPPWGGPGYRSDEIFDLHTMEPYSLSRLVDCFQNRLDSFALYLPRTSDVRQLAAKTRPGSMIAVTHYCMEGASKAMCAYFGAWNELPPLEH